MVGSWLFKGINDPRCFLDYISHLEFKPKFFLAENGWNVGKPQF